MKILVMTGMVLLLCLPMHANAGLMTYFGQDTSPGGVVPPLGNAAAARQSFLSNLAGGVGTEDFEGIPGGTGAPLSLSFPGSTGSIGATLNGSGSVRTTPTTGTFATSGSRFWDTGTGGNFSVTFSSPIAAFGFYGTDIGDVQGNLVLTLAGGGSQVFTLNTSGSPNGSLLFWGFTDDVNTYTSITFTNTGSGDRFGFDDMTIGDLGQINPQVPEPTSLAVFGLFGVAVALRRRKSQKPN